MAVAVEEYQFVIASAKIDEEKLLSKYSLNKIFKCIINLLFCYQANDLKEQYY